MRFITKKTELLEALTITGKAITKNVIPILDCYCFDISGNSLKITGSNLEIFISHKMEIIDCGFSKKIAIPSARIVSLIKALPEVPIEFTIEERKVKEEVFLDLKIKAGKGKYNIPIEKGEDFPQPKNKKEGFFQLKKSELFKGVDMTLFACSNDETRPNICSVNIEFADNEVTYTATNGHILSTYTFPSEIKGVNQLLIQAKYLSILQNLPVDDLIKVYIEDSHIEFELNEETVFISRLTTDKYPDYKSVIPKELVKKLSVNRLELINAIKRVCLFADPETHLVAFYLSKDSFTIVSANTGLNEEAIEEIYSDYTDEPLIIGFNGNYLISALNKFNTEKVFFWFKGHNYGAILRDNDAVCDDLKNRVLLMPMMVEN